MPTSRRLLPLLVVAVVAGCNPQAPAASEQDRSNATAGSRSAEPLTAGEAARPEAPNASTAGIRGAGEVPPPGARTAPQQVARLSLRVLAVHPHDPQAFTQGLLWHEGSVLESTGLYGSSELRRWDLESGALLDRVELPRTYFGEGLARVDRRLVQLTWQEGVARVYDLDSFRLLAEVPYEGDGWGLCYDGRRLVMTDGGDRLVFRDPETLAFLGEVAVTLEGEPVPRLNELECRPEGIYANLLGRDEIVRIEPASGRVDAVIDASGLLTAAERAAAEVMNGIAYRPETGTFLLTGKLWPKTFEVELVE